MPWVRKGRDIFKQNADGSAGAKVGHSSSVAMAKQALKARYANAGPEAKKKKGK